MQQAQKIRKSYAYNARLNTLTPFQSSFKNLSMRLLHMLSHSSRTVVICSLVLIGYLDENNRNTVFSPQNISQAFVCIFNVLGSADSIMTVHIASDLLRKLIIAETVGGTAVVLDNNDKL